MVEGIVDHPLGARWKPHATHCVEVRCLSHGNELPWQHRSPHGWFRAAGAARTQLYTPNAVDHILTGKAVSRPVRAHILLDAVLKALLLSDPLRGTQGRTAEDSQVLDGEPMSGLAEDNVIHPDPLQ